MSNFRNLAKLIHFHPILFAFVIIAFLTGTFMQMTIIFIIIFWHEMGHYLAARYFKWRITEIMFWVFGGVMKTDENGNQSIKEDVIVTIFGPIQHGIIYVVLSALAYYNLLPSGVIGLAMYYNTLILGFNLLPIYPLDGGKLTFYLLSMLYPYRKAYNIIIGFSIISCLSIILLQIFILPFTLSAILLMMFILLENRLEWKNRYYTFMRFLINRKVNKRKQVIKKLNVDKDMKLIDVFSLFYREKYHEMYFEKSLKTNFTEEECLKGYFEEHKYSETLHEWLHSVKIDK